MANITDPASVSYSDNFVRTGADKLAQTYYELKIAVDLWNAGKSVDFPNYQTALVEDGAFTGDGRDIISGLDVNSLMSLCEAFVTDMEDSDNTNLNKVLAVSPNPEK